MSWEKSMILFELRGGVGFAPTWGVIPRAILWDLHFSRTPGRLEVRVSRSPQSWEDCWRTLEPGRSSPARWLQPGSSGWRTVIVPFWGLCHFPAFISKYVHEVLHASINLQVHHMQDVMRSNYSGEDFDSSRCSLWHWLMSPTFALISGHE